MGILSSTRRRGDDNLPTGLPTNTYWRNRTTEKVWHLREALLDGNVEDAAHLLGIQLEPSNKLEEASQGDPQVS